MKDKNVAGILALFLGAFGVHRFYLGQTGLGILYAVFFMTGISTILGIIDAIVFFSMDQDTFDIKYNREHYRASKKDNTDFERRERRSSAPVQQRRQDRREERREKAPQQRSKIYIDNTSKAAEFKRTGINKYKDFEFDSAIEDFLKALEFTPNDVAIHFNLACSYSLTEQADKAFFHLDQAVGLGFNDYQRIKTHDAFAYLRIQPQFEEFEQHGFRLVGQLQLPGKEENLLEQITNTDLLQQLQKLNELKEKGLLTEEEYDLQRRKLTN
ncbi:MAG: NINE protein [Haliscomenobacter sp.]|nr:NINE protein [Haliscomenobacter sp.]MBK8654956.1 NINE protein [Haliscomenobacter sp.]MBP9075424.1 NINE protein [Haliscomenobacter sp.]MBP9873961.1 NINE protein [Haliscomenobacter sp.]